MIFRLQRRPQIILQIIKSKVVPIVCAAIFMVVALTSCSGEKSKEPIEESVFALDTFVTIRIYDPTKQKALDGAIKMCNDFEDVFSSDKEGAQLYELNHRDPSEQVVKVSDDLASCIQTALEYCKKSDGAFDITVQPLRKYWDFKSDDPELPRKEDVDKDLAKVDYKKVHVNGNEIHFDSPDTQIDLGAIAKGYIADRLKDYLEKEGVHSAIINLGGNVLCIGKKPDGSDFTIGLQRPFADRQETIGAVKVSDLSVVSSGVYERHFIIDGKNYHHILDPKTGFPYDNGIVQVSIITKKSVDADALSTVCFSLGVDKGIALVNQIPDTYAIYVMDDYSMRYSDGAEKLIQEDR